MMKLGEMTLVAAVLLTACDSDQGSGSREDPYPIPRDGSKTHLYQRTLSPGSTNASTTPLFILEASFDMPSPAAAGLAATLEYNMAFTAADGEDVILANITWGKPGDSLDAGTSGWEPSRCYRGSCFAVTPKVPLQADTWYEVRWTSTAAIVIHSDDTYELGADVLTSFYTGSALQLRKLEVALAGDVPVSKMLVYLSEPVDLQDVLSGGIAVTRPTFSADPCISWPGGCLQPGSSGTLVSVFQYEFATELPARFDLAMALSLRGVANTVGEAASKGAVRGTTLTNDRSLLYELDMTRWRPRINAGTFGWSNAE